MFNGGALGEKPAGPRHLHSTSTRSTVGSSSHGSNGQLFCEGSRTRSKNAEMRYTAEFEDSLQSEVDPSLIESDENTVQQAVRSRGKPMSGAHARKRSHQRTKSIYIEPKNSYSHVLTELQHMDPAAHSHAQSEVPKHMRKASDADSVVLAAPGDESFTQKEKQQEADQSVSVEAIGFADPRHPANRSPEPERASMRLRQIPALGEL
jgi:hypothetical protein